jgi:hypothetical protein
MKKYTPEQITELLLRQIFNGGHCGVENDGLLIIDAVTKENHLLSEDTVTKPLYGST